MRPASVQVWRGEERNMPTRLDMIIGNQSLCSRLSEDVDRGSLAHAYIIEGAAGSGRRTLARALIAAACCEERGGKEITPCQKCSSCKKIMGNRCPDVLHVGLEPDRSTIGVEAIRYIKTDVYTAPNDLEVKAYIIEDADLMTVQAQTAFLLLLESPPPYALFFLICQNSTALLETVRSRAPSLRMEKLPLDKVEQYLLENERRARTLKTEKPEEFGLAIFFGNGSIGESISLLDGRRRAAIADAKQAAEKLISMLIAKDKSAAFEALSGNLKRAEVSKQIAYLQLALRDLIMLKKSDGVRLCFFNDRERATELSTHFSFQSLFALYDASVNAAEALESNANVRLTLMTMMQNAGII
ncbi:MAG: hypothetical protein IJC64_02090 [Clostridia bacterium]|nr:hypothetical protein [Clostridia bacterium]